LKVWYAFSRYAVSRFFFFFFFLLLFLFLFLLLLVLLVVTKLGLMKKKYVNNISMFFSKLFEAFFN